MPYWPGPGFLNPGPIQPWAGIGQTILIKRVQKYILYQVGFMEQLPPSAPLVRDFGAIGAATATTATQLSAQSLQAQLEMDGYEFAQIRFYPLDDVSVNVYQPQVLNRFVVKNTRARYSRKTLAMDPYQAMTEMAVFQSDFPFFDVLNSRQMTIAMSRIAFYGFRYRINRKINPATDDFYPAYNGIDEVPNIPYAAVMAEGFVGTGFVRSAV